MLCIGHQAKPLFLHFLQTCALITQMYRDIFKTSVFHRLICVIWALSVLEILSWYQQRNTVSVLSVSMPVLQNREAMIHLANDFSTQHEQGVHSMGKWGGAESVNERGYRARWTHIDKLLCHTEGGQVSREGQRRELKLNTELKRNLSNLFAAPSHVTPLVVHLLTRSTNYSH